MKHELKAPKFSETLTTLKRSHDQITSPGNETAERSPKIEGASEDALEPLKNFPAGGEKHAKRCAASDSRDSSYATAGTFGQEGLPREETTVKKSDHPNPIEGLSQLRQKLPDRVAGVSSQPGIILPGSQSNKLTPVQDSMNARDISAVPAHSMQMGKTLHYTVFNCTISLQTSSPFGGVAILGYPGAVRSVPFNLFVSLGRKI